MTIADRIANLGTETAFAVSAEAAAFAAQGNHVYPFHLGDMNLPTPSTVVDGAIKALRDGKTGYCPNAGIPQLREALADNISASHGVSYTADNVAAEGPFQLDRDGASDGVISFCYDGVAIQMVESQFSD